MAGIIVGKAASLFDNNEAVQTQSYGPEARGGASKCEVVISDDEIVGLNIPTGVPLVYEFDEYFHVLNKRYLGDQDKIKAAMDAVKNQGKAK